MTVGEKLRVIAECVRALHDGEWSVREVVEIARIARVPVRDKTAYEALYELDLPGRRAPGKRRQFSTREAFQLSENACEKVCGENTAGSISTGSKSTKTASPELDLDLVDRSLDQYSKLVSRSRSSLESLLPLTSFGDAGDSNASHPSRETLPKRSRTTRGEPDTSWIAPLEKQALALFSVRLDAFTKEQRNIAGRYHALRFSNCNREAFRNKEIGRKIAAGLTTLGSNSMYGDMTFKEYVGYAEEIHAQCDGKPWYDPWLIKAAVEFEKP